MSGTVNILTDSGSGEPLHGDLDVQGGGLGLFRGVANAAGSTAKDRLNYSLGVSDLSVTEGVADAGQCAIGAGREALRFCCGRICGRWRMSSRTKAIWH